MREGLREALEREDELRAFHGDPGGRRFESG
jgi:hypothetical protein